MKYSLQILLLLAFTFGGGLSLWAQVLDPNDPLFIYDSNNPPKQPLYGQVGKWTAKLDRKQEYKAYIYKGMPVRLQFPKGYNPNEAVTYPVTVMFHGRGENRKDFYDNDKHLSHGANNFTAAIRDGKYNGYVLHPHSYGGWDDAEMQKIAEFLEYMIDNAHADPYRISVHGLSNGGKAVWSFFYNQTKYTASALPMSGIGSDRSTNTLSRIRYTPIWLSQGGQDKNPTPDASKQLADAIEAVGGGIRYTLYRDAGHGVWGRHYNEPDFFPFLMRANKVNPWPLYGRSEFCPGDAVKVTLGLTPGFEGYEWRKDGQVIAGATKHELPVTSFGVYDARIKRDGQWSYWSPQPVVVKVKEETQTPAPVLAQAHSGAIPSPDGRGYTVLELPEGYASYAWKQVGSSAVVGNESTLKVTTPGQYVATVTEEFGCTSIASAAFRVVSATGANAPAPVTALSANMVSKTQVALSWQHNASTAYPETGFEVYRSEQANGDFVLVTVAEANASGYIDKGLATGTKYYYLVRTINANGASATTKASGSTESDTVLPSVPGNLRAGNYTTSSVFLRWNGSTDDVGVAHYVVYRDGVQILTTTDTETTIYNLVPNGQYNFTVRAKDVSDNLSPVSNTVLVTTQAKNVTYAYYEGSFSKVADLENLTPKKTGQTDNIDITLRDREDNFAFTFQATLIVLEDGAYTFYTTSDDGSKLYINGQQVVDNDGRHGSRERNGRITLTAGNHDLRVSYFNGGGGKRLQLRWQGPGFGKRYIPISAYYGDEAATVRPNVPSALTANATSYKKVILNWQDNSSNESAFRLYRSTGASGSFSVLTTLGKDTEQFVDATVQANTTYRYHVQAVSKGGASAVSNTTSTTTPSAPAVVPQKLFTTRINFTKNATAPSPWYNTGKDPVAGDSFVNLPDEQGSGTGITLTLLTPWGGSFNQGANSGNNSGVVPDAALAEYYWFGTFGAPNTVDIELSGLDPAKLYAFKFVGSSVFNLAGITDNGTTVYTLGGQSASVYVQDNTSDYAFIEGYSPNGDGKARIRISKANGTPVGYLNALIVEAFSNPSISDGLLATTLQTFSESKSSLRVDWLDIPAANGYALYRSTTANGSYSKVYQGNATTYTDAGLQAATTYYYKVNTLYTEGNRESGIASASTLQSQVFINMNGSKNYNAPFPWNNTQILPEDSDVLGGFKDEVGDATGLAIAFEKSMTGSNDWGVSTGNNTGLYPDRVSKSFFFMETFDKARLVVKGLDQTMRYNFVFFNSIVMDFQVTTDFTIGEETVVADATNNTEKAATIWGVRPDANGEIVINVTSEENWSIFNAMVIEAYPDGGATNARTQSGSKPVAYDIAVRQGDELVAESNLIGVYPNPFDNDLVITLPTTIDGQQVEVSLIDVLGRSVYTRRMNVAGANMHLPDLPVKPGTYLLKVATSQSTKTFRLLKE
jgi:predicted esterase/fibronectin type 3 domain-containing protein